MYMQLPWSTDGPTSGRVLTKCVNCRLLGGFYLPLSNILLTLSWHVYKPTIYWESAETPLPSTAHQLGEALAKGHTLCRNISPMMRGGIPHSVFHSRTKSQRYRYGPRPNTFCPGNSSFLRIGEATISRRTYSTVTQAVEPSVRPAPVQAVNHGQRKDRKYSPFHRISYSMTDNKWVRGQRHHYPTVTPKSYCPRDSAYRCLRGVNEQRHILQVSVCHREIHYRQGALSKRGTGNDDGWPSRWLASNFSFFQKHTYRAFLKLCITVRMWGNASHALDPGAGPNFLNSSFILQNEHTHVKPLRALRLETVKRARRLCTMSHLSPHMHKRPSSKRMVRCRGEPCSALVIGKVQFQ